MNHELWSEHLAARISELERDLRNARREASRQRKRAAYWSDRAIAAATDLRLLRRETAVFRGNMARR